MNQIAFISRNHLKTQASPLERNTFNSRQYALHQAIERQQSPGAPLAKKHKEELLSENNSTKATEAVSGDVLLQRMFTPSTSEISRPEAPVDRFEQLARLVESIRVATPRFAGQGEIHIAMKEGIWKGTTIQLNLSGNQLQIDIVTTRENSQLINAHKDRLIQQLSEACPGLRPSVSISSSNDSLPDGRSRQQYLPEQEEDEL